MTNTIKLLEIPLTEETAAQLELLRHKKLSLEHLYRSFLQDRADGYGYGYGDFKQREFLDIYEETCLEFDSILKGIFQQVLSEEAAAPLRPWRDKCLLSFSYLGKVIGVELCKNLLKKGERIADQN